MLPYMSGVVLPILQWRHNQRDGVSNHQRLHFFATVCSGADQWKHQSSASQAFLRGIHRWPVNSPHKRPVTRIMFPFDDVIMNSSREREIKFIGLFGDRWHRGPYSPYKLCNHNLYIGIIIFPHIDNPQSTGYNYPTKKTNKIINEKVRAPLIWQIIGEKDSGSVYMWI